MTAACILTGCGSKQPTSVAGPYIGRLYRQYICGAARHFWLARSGAAGADIPDRYGQHQTVYIRFCKWRDDGSLLQIFHALNEDANYK